MMNRNKGIAISAMIGMLSLLVIGSLAAAGGLKAVNSENPGAEIDLKQFLVAGKINIIDFYSEFCPPCVRIAPYLEQLVEKSPDKVVIKIDINRPGIRGIDWGSPLARQFNLNSIPHFKIYDEEGSQMAEGGEAFNLLIRYFSDNEIRIR